MFVKHACNQTAYHVWAVGSCPYVGAGEIWNFGVRSLNPPGGSCEQPVVNCSSLERGAN